MMKKRAREQELWYLTSMMNIMASWHSQMKNINLPKSQIPTFVHMHESFWSMVKAKKGIGHGTSSLLKCVEQLRLQRSNTPKREVGVMFGYLVCHAAMADDALHVNAMNVKPGGKQRIMRDTTS